ncbi:MAG: hypothetical protein WAU00_00340, partial [Caldilinea sp.]
VETWRNQFASRDSLFLFAVKTHCRRRREMPALLAQPEHAHLHARRFRTPRAVEGWVDAVARQYAAAGAAQSREIS